MASYKAPRCKQVRRLGLNVYGLPKANERMREDASRAHRRMTEYGAQLLEKQRLRAYYNTSEKQFRSYVESAKKSDEPTASGLIRQLETRLDNLVYRLGFASSIFQARQMVVHGHIRVDEKKVDRPSYAVKPGQTVALRDRAPALFKENYETAYVTSWPYLTKEENFRGTLTRYPEREEVPVEINDQLVVEYYSRLL